MSVQNGIHFSPYKSTPARCRIVDRPDATREEQLRERRDQLRDLVNEAIARMDNAGGWYEFLRAYSYARKADGSTATACNVALMALQAPGQEAFTVTELGTGARRFAGREDLRIWTVGRGFSPVFRYITGPPAMLPVPDATGCDDLARDWRAEPGNEKGERKGKHFRAFIERQEGRLLEVMGDLVPVTMETIEVPDDSAKVPDPSEIF